LRPLTMKSLKFSQLMNKGPFILTMICLFLASCSENMRFELQAPKKTGIEFTNTLTETDELNILDYLYFYNGGGVAIGDINNDSLPDIFFTGNQVKNKLYLNQGNLKFKDISASAGIEGKSSWNTGTTMADVNGDGFLDIYVCAVVGINGFNGYNELYINNGDNTFTESAASFGLDFDSYSSNATFFDYDLDGDLDMYLLNHAVHTQNSYGDVSLREKRTYETGDKLLRNDGGNFIDVSKDAGIYGGLNGYGLGIAVSDFNLDGYPDFYVGNDFHEDDYYYLNNGDGTFTESLKQFFGHSSRFSIILRVDGRVRKNLSLPGHVQAVAPVAVASANLPRGAILTPSNTFMEKRNLALLKDPCLTTRTLFGKRLKHAVRAGNAIRSSYIESPPLVQKGQLVKIIFNNGPLFLSATGVARMSGKRDEIIRVQNSSSKKMIFCKITAPGIVEVQI